MCIRDSLWFTSRYVIVVAIEVDSGAETRVCLRGRFWIDRRGVEGKCSDHGRRLPLCLSLIHILSAFHSANVMVINDQYS